MCNALCLLLQLCAIISFSSAFNLAPKFAELLTEPSRQEGSYFGYTVNLRSAIRGYASSIVIGAPRANSNFKKHRSIKKPGVVYQCNIDDLLCHSLLLDPTGNELRKTSQGFTERDRKDNAWIGGTIQGLDSRGDQIVVCGPRWVNVPEDKYRPTVYLQNGVCYWLSDTMDANKTAVKLMPLINRARQQFAGKYKAYYDFAFGQAGFSAHLVNGGRELVLGAPGLLNWKGGIIRYRHDVFSGSFNQPLVPNTYFNKYINYESYFGYAVSSGNFFNKSNEISYVAGAPRESYYKGKVFIFKLHEERLYREIDIINELEGQQMGEYFGSALCVLDVTGDGFDDIIVGAPQHSLMREAVLQVGDEGAVYVFINNKEGRFEPQSMLNSKHSFGARFGTTIASLGDLNKDGYKDVAVGAPYEDNGRGAVYIYFGSKNGLGPNFVQRIGAMDISLTLKGFGISLSHGVDIDGNKYNDLAVGAYLSEHAVLIKSHPIVTLIGNLVSNVQEVSITMRNFQIQACIQFRGNDGPQNVNVSAVVKADPLSRRATFVIGSRETAEHQLTFGLLYGVITCQNITVKTEPTSQDFSKPLEFRMEYKLMHDVNQDKIFCATCPVINPAAQNTHLLRIPFSTGCGDDLKCDTNLALSAKFNYPRDTLVIGSQKTIGVSVTISNSGESAFLVKLTVETLQTLHLVRLPSYCSEVDRKIQCELGNILSTNDQKTVDFEFDISSVTPSMESIFVNVSVTSVGTDVDPTNNIKILELKLSSEARIVISGKSIPDQIFYASANNTIKNSLKFFQEFDIRNYGPSPVERLNFEVEVPVALDKVNFLEMVQYKAFLDGQPIACPVLAQGLSSDGIPEIAVELGDVVLERRKRQVFDNGPVTQMKDRAIDLEKHNNEKILRDAETNELSFDAYPLNRTQLFNCSGLDSKVFCIKIFCEFGPLKPLESNAIFRLFFKPNVTNIEKTLKKKDIVLIATNASVVPLVNVVITNKESLSTVVYTTLLGSLPGESVPILIIVVGIIVGLVILSLIAYGLYKAGFFKRKEMEEMKKLKDADYQEQTEVDQDLSSQ